jgi:hypothetical protein
MTTPGLPKEVERERKQQYWGDHLRTWRKSGLTQAEYCRRNQLSTKCFTYWKSKTRRPDPPMKLVTIPVRPVIEHRQSAEIVVVFKDRYRVEVGDGFNPATFEKVVQVLAQL